MKRILLLLLLALPGVRPLSAIQDGTGNHMTAPTNANVPGWTSGWGTSGITGWDYVGQTADGNSGVYLGYGWVLTAGHVGLHNFTLSGTTYLAVPNSRVGISANNSPVDLCLFQLQTQPNLPPLVIRASDPKAFFTDSSGSPVVMIGFSGGKSWGYDTVTNKNQLIELAADQNYTSNDFLTYLGTYSNGSTMITNNAYLYTGDSGGGDFIYNPAASRWELAGINEAVGPSLSNIQYSAFVQLNTYAAQISAILLPPSDAPTIPLWGLVVLACLLLVVAARRVPRPAQARAG